MIMSIISFTSEQMLKIWSLHKAQNVSKWQVGNGILNNLDLVAYRYRWNNQDWDYIPYFIYKFTLMLIFFYKIVHNFEHRKHQPLSATSDVQLTHRWKLLDDIQ